MLSFQITNKGESITVYCDLHGLDEWIKELTDLRASSGASHIHMRAPSAGGELLSDENPWGEAAIGEVIVSLG